MCRCNNVTNLPFIGTGKSVLLREIIRHCRGDDRPREGLAVTAATGIASVNIGGSTLHSWAGIGLGKESAEKLLGKLLGQDKYQREKERLRRKKLREQGMEVDDNDECYYDDDMHVPRVVERWRIVETLIIDESKIQYVSLPSVSPVDILTVSMIDGVLFDKLVRMSYLADDKLLDYTIPTGIYCSPSTASG